MLRWAIVFLDRFSLSSKAATAAENGAESGLANEKLGYVKMVKIAQGMPRSAVAPHGLATIC